MKQRQHSVSMRLGVTLLGLAAAAEGLLDLIWGNFDTDHQPIQAFGDHIPGLRILAYITGAWMLAGGAAILTRQTAKLGAAALAAIYFIIAVFWLPRFITAPRFLGYHFSVYCGVFGGLGTQLIVVIAAALIYTTLATQSSSWPRTTLIARWAFGICPVDFGLVHLIMIKDGSAYVPRWMPLGAGFWTDFTGICFVLAGLAIITGILDVLAARLLALMFLVFNAVALPHFIFDDPRNHAAWGGSAYNLAAVASAWIVAEWLAARRAGPGPNAQSTP